MRPRKNYSPLAQRLIVHTVLFSSAVTLLLTAMQLYRDYRLDLAQIDTQFTEIERVHLRSLASALWATDKAELEVHLDGMRSMRDIEYLAVVESGRIWAQTSEPRTKNVIVRRYALNHLHRGEMQQLGELRVVASLDGVYTRLLDKAVIVLVSNGVKTFLVAVFILLLFHRLVTRRLQAVAQQVQDSSYPGDIDAQRSGRGNTCDEIDDLVAALNVMRAQLRTNLTDLREQTAVLHANEQRLRLALRAGVMGIFDWDVQSGVIVWSEEHARLFGMPLKDFDGRYDSFVQRVHPDDLARIERAVENARTNQSLFQEEYRIVWPDGSLHWISGQGQFLYDPDGQTSRMTGVVTDITERKRATDELRRNEERFQLVTQASNDVIWDWNMLHSTLWWNRNFLQQFGYRPEEIEDGLESWTNRIHPHDVDGVVAGLHAVIDHGGRFWKNEYRFRRHDGSYAYIFDRGYVIHDDQGKPVRMVGAMVDLSERRCAEEALQQLTHELEQRVAARTAELAETNIELEAFSYTVSHDLRAPLRAVQGLAQALQEDYADKLDTQGREYAQRLVTAAERLDGLIQDLLAYSRLTRADLRPEVVELDSVLQRVREQLAIDIAQSGATLQVQTPLPAVVAHPATLVQVVANLMANAIKFVAPGVQPVVKLRAEHRGKSARLWIEDNGIGIEPEYRERIFQVFERLHGIETYPGTGIGLAIVRKGVERMEGTVGVESALCQGSRFWIELPLSTG